MVLVLLSASVERFSVSRMQYFFVLDTPTGPQQKHMNISFLKSFQNLASMSKIKKNEKWRLGGRKGLWFDLYPNISMGNNENRLFQSRVDEVSMSLLPDQVSLNIHSKAGVFK